MSAPFIMPEPASAAEARALHSRRALYSALSHGLALGDAIGLSPAALDVIDEAILFMDTLDAKDEDLEPSLAGWWDPTLGPPDGEVDEADLEDDGGAEPSLGAPEMHESTAAKIGVRWYTIRADQRHWASGATSDREADIVDEPHDDEGEAEGTLGWAANVSQLGLGQTTDDREVTALETFGRGFVRSGPDDAESDELEPDDEHGSDEDQRIPVRFLQSGPLPLAERGAIVDLVRQAKALREAAHV